MTPPRQWHVRGRVLSLERPLVMGIVNVTPDSFSDGGRFMEPEDAVRHGRALLREGADLLDVGGESTRPGGAAEVTAAEEIARIVPVIRALAAQAPDAVLSVDTVKSEVARAALAAGAHVINDVSAFRLDPRSARVAADAGAGVVLMHSRGGVCDMASYVHADYPDDVLNEVERELGAQLLLALAAGVARECIAVDPGIGFAKRPADSLRLIGGLARLASWGHPVLVGVSRKRFIGSITGQPVPAERVSGSVGAAVAAWERGASIFRVHDVAATRQALDVAAAIRRAGCASLQPA